MSKSKRTVNYRRGYVAEAQFIADAIGQGLEVSQPFHQNVPYDLIVSGKKRHWKVQVKSVTYKERGQYYVRLKKRQSGGVHTSYSAGDLDVFAICTPQRDWFLIPFLHAPRTTLRIGLAHQKFINNWRVFK